MTTTDTTEATILRVYGRFIVGWRIFGAAYHVERIDHRYSDGRRVPWWWEIYTEVDERHRVTTYHLGPVRIVREVGITEEGRRWIARETCRFCTLFAIYFR